MARGTIIAVMLKDGSKRYRTIIRISGKQQWRTFLKKKDAEDYLDRNSTDIRDGVYREIKRATFGQYLKHWRETYLIPEKLKPSTIAGYDSIIDAHLMPAFEHRPMSAIETAHLTEFEAGMLKKSESPATVRNVMQLFGRILKDARREHYLRVSPMDDVTKRKVQKTKRGRALKVDEIRQVLAQCAETLRVIVMIALLAGLRRSEVFALHWTDDSDDPRTFVDFEHDVIRIRKALFFKHGKHVEKKEGDPNYVFTPPKSSQSVRDVPLSPALKKELLMYKLKCSDKQGLVFQTANGTPLDPNNVCRYKPEPKPQPGGCPDVRKSKLPRVHFCDAVRQAEIGKVRFHDLRHTYGSMKIDQGENIYDVQRWMGHSSIQVTIDVYGHPITDRGQSAAEKTDALLFGNAQTAGVAAAH